MQTVNIDFANKNPFGRLQSRHRNLMVSPLAPYGGTLNHGIIGPCDRELRITLFFPENGILIT